MSTHTPTTARDQTPRPTQHPRRPLPVWFSLVLATVLIGATLYGLLADDAYRIADDVAAQGRGQDLLTLLTVPVLIWGAVRARAGSLRAHLVWLGLLLYVTYTYISYAFGVPFNAAFLLYVAATGLGSYGLLDGLLRIRVGAVAPAFARAPRRGVSTVLFVSAALFCLAWLSDIVPALVGGLPDSRMAYDLPNPIHVLDLAWLIPVVVATAVMLRRRRPAADVLAAVLLVKLLTLSIAIVFMVGFMVAGGEAIDPVVTAMFVALGAAAGWLLVRGARRMDAVDAPWLTASIWHS